MTESMIYMLLSFAAINVLVSILIVAALRKRNVKVNFVLIRLYMLKYANQYKNITVQESGSPGPLYYLWTLSIVAMGLSAAGLLIVAKFM